jgi:F-type H+-transporting ATPase subunit b
MADRPGTSTEVPGSGHAAHAFPPFDKQTFPSQLLWLTLTFVALYLLMSRIALPRIDAILGARRTRISGDLAEAQRLKDESDAAIAAYEKSLADARTRAQALLAESLDAALNARIAEAERGIAAQKSAALANVRDIATEAAAAIVERLIGMAPVSREAVVAAVAEALKS